MLVVCCPFRDCGGIDCHRGSSVGGEHNGTKDESLTLPRRPASPTTRGPTLAPTPASTLDPRQIGQIMGGRKAGDWFGESGDGRILAGGAICTSDNGAWAGHVRVYRLTKVTASGKKLAKHWWA